MTNQEGFTTVTPLTLQRDCFTSEQDRLNEYARSMRIPIQTGQIIKGDKGDKGDKGEQGFRGPKGDEGAPGATPVPSTTSYVIDEGEDEIEIPLDLRNKIVHLVYLDPENDPPSLINIMCMRYTEDNTTMVYLSGVTPDGNFRISVTTY